MPKYKAKTKKPKGNPMVPRNSRNQPISKKLAEARTRPVRMAVLNHKILGTPKLVECKGSDQKQNFDKNNNATMTAKLVPNIGGKKIQNP